MSGAWKGTVGAVDTIYEEEDHDVNDDKCSSLPSSTSSPNSKLASPSHPRRDLNLHSRVQSWSMTTGEKADVSIYVQGTCFNLHKGPLTSRSSYFRRQLKELSRVTLPLNITAETFTLVAEFCYGAHLAITPFNLASLRTAAELLGMTAVDCRFHHNLAELTESYFDRVVAANRPLALIVLKASIRLLPESETAAGLVTRCVESLDLDSGGDMNDLADDILQLRAAEFLIVAESIQCQIHCHDELYLLVDLYIRNRGREMSEEEKTEICNCVDCDKLSPQLLVHAVQNHRLPLRFIVRAMLIEQLNTRRAIFATKTGEEKSDRAPSTGGGGGVTLGTLLRQGAAAREAGKIKEEMESTSFRIRGLEKEIEGMKKLLMKSEEDKTVLEKQLMLERWAMGAGEEIGSAVVRDGDCRSASFHYGGKERNRVQRGERGSSSFAAGSRGRVEREGKKKKGSGKGMGIIEKLKSKFQGFQLIGSECRPQGRFSGGEKGNGDGKGEVDGQTIKVANSHKRTQSLA
ncbi:unnamed protein product [Linum tenue]|uniref:BTB/POZ domain-containing protein n=1 Tax=Linum tenue TaxID=586396 RepID=A0AAV0L9Q2_9ROSI|nr:unnamed protein product [Linum tenue]